MTQESLKIQSATKEYFVVTGHDFKTIQSLTTLENAFFVIDSNVYKLHNELFKDIPEERLFL